MKYILSDEIMGLLQPKSLASIAALLLLGTMLLLVARKTRFNTRMLSYGALCMAASFILSYVKVFELPYGGTITLASMLPLLFYAGAAGPWAGMAVGMCYGLLQYIQDPFFVHPAQFVLDYPLAFGMLGIAGFFGSNIRLGSIAGVAGRFACHFLSGVIFFWEYAEGKNVYLYSLGYNASYLVPDLLLCLLVLSVPQVKNAMRSVSRLAVKHS